MRRRHRKEGPQLEVLRTRYKRAKQYLRKLEESKDGFCTCISCGERIPLFQTTAGHYIPQYIACTETEDDNIWPQCEHCNRELNGNMINYRKNLIDKIGLDRVVRLETLYRAYKGDSLAMASLSFKDQDLIYLNRDKKYYEREYSRTQNEIKSYINNIEYKEYLKDNDLLNW